MSMERIEERCLAHLSQAANPLVPFRTLLEYVRREEDARQIGEQELLAFLKYHELIHVVDTGNPENGATELPPGLMPDRYAILKSRIPNRKELAQNLREQLEQMRVTLQAALDEARETGDYARVSGLEHALNRADELDDRFGKL